MDTPKASRHGQSVRGSRLAAGPSVGIAMFPSDGMDGDALIRKADQAMYKAKLDGGQRQRFFDSPLTPANTGARASTRRDAE